MIKKLKIDLKNDGKMGNLRTWLRGRKGEFIFWDEEIGKFVGGLLLEKKRFLLAFKEGTVKRL